jgi:hypothetical protein
VKSRSNLRSLVGASFLALVVCASTAYTAADGPPEILARLGERVRCQVLSDKTLATPWGVVTAWVVEREAGTAYAAWCARESQGRVVYDLLVTATAPQHSWAQCTPHIRLGMNKPFPRLRVTILPRDLPYPKTLGEFWYLGEDWLADGQPAGGSGIPQGPALDIGVGDAGQILMCAGGRWIMGGYHYATKATNDDSGPRRRC